MKVLIAAILDHFTEFSWKRFRSFVIVILVIVGAFMLFDGYTSFFTMNRLNRAAEVISKLQSIEQGGKMSPELESSYTTLRHQLAMAAASKPWTVRLSVPRFDIPQSSLLKFTAGMVPFGLFSFVFIGDIFRREQGAAAGFLGVWIIASIFGLITFLIPIVWWPWFNLAAVPVGLFVGFIGFVVVIGIQQTKKQKVKGNVGSDSNGNT
jgi:hypothetical protein